VEVQARINKFNQSFKNYDPLYLPGLGYHDRDYVRDQYIIWAPPFPGFIQYVAPDPFHEEDDSDPYAEWPKIMDL
jgi:hypothetical protein